VSGSCMISWSEEHVYDIVKAVALNITIVC
jgi:hypothetical protein